MTIPAQSEDVSFMGAFLEKPDFTLSTRVLSGYLLGNGDYSSKEMVNQSELFIL